MAEIKALGHLRRGSIHENLEGSEEIEGLDDLLVLPGTRVERIVSWGQGSPPGSWYEQAWTEWVLVVSGAATLEIEGSPEPTRMGSGDWLLLPPHCKHRVVSTSSRGPTIWLAVHVGE